MATDRNELIPSEQPEYAHVSCTTLRHLHSLHQIIRWDEAGEVIIIEKPDELAEKILPLVYRQSRFASFSRQLNVSFHENGVLSSLQIYGFMRKVSLRHVDRGICDPDASTWCECVIIASASATVLDCRR